VQEQVKQQHIAVKVYRTDERLMVASPMAGLEPENILVEGIYSCAALCRRDCGYARDRDGHISASGSHSGT